MRSLGRAAEPSVGIMNLSLSFDESVGTFFGVYKPREGHTVENAIEYLAKFPERSENAGCLKCVVLKSRLQGCVAVYAVFQKVSDADTVITIHPELDRLAKEIATVAETVDLNWYEISSAECKHGKSIWELSKGDVVHLRGIMTNPKRQDILSYSCLAILKAYFHLAQGLLCCAFYNSLDGRKIVELGVWESVEAAHSYQKLSPAPAYWKALGATLTYSLYEVALIYAKKESHLCEKHEKGVP